RERLAGGALALRDLVLVMREDQIDPARMQIDRLAEQALRHRGAFQVPPGPPRRDAELRELPRRLPFALPLPQHEVARVLLRIAVGIDARAGLHPLVIETRELAV